VVRDRLLEVWLSCGTDVCKVIATFHVSTFHYEAEASILYSRETGLFHAFSSVYVAGEGDGYNINSSSVFRSRTTNVKNCFLFSEAKSSYTIVSCNVNKRCRYKSLLFSVNNSENL
jgi:hypothetical protein